MKIERISRRSFLKIGTALGGGLLVKAYWVPSLDAAEKDAEIASDSPWFFAHFESDGSVLLELGKQEMGQSAQIGLAMLFAEEACLDWSRVRVSQVSGDKRTHAFYDSAFGQGTGGSATVSSLWDPMRKAGACVRAMLRQAAAQLWDVTVEDCAAKDGYIAHAESRRRLAYHELAAEAARLPVPTEPKLKDKSEYELIGRPVDNRHNDAIVTGQANYSSNVRLPAMAYAAVARCPVLGAKLVSIDDRAALEVPGVLGVHVIEGQPAGEDLFYDYRGGVAVVADSTWAAFEGKKALRLVWDEGQNGVANYALLRDRFARREVVRSEIKNDFGDTEAAFRDAAKTLDAVYETGFQAHAPMEPLGSVARVMDGQAEVWASTQSVPIIRSVVARALRLDVANVTVHSPMAGGSFGRRIWADFAVESAILAAKIGRPVKVTWSREDDFQSDYFHPYKISEWQGCLDAEGYISGIRLEYGVLGANSFWWILHWAYLPYGIQNVRTRAHLLEEPIPTGAWRSVTEHLQAFPEESFIDELAHLAGEDPYRFRLKHARRAVATFEGEDYWRQMTERALRVLESVSKISDWDQPLPQGAGRGIALSKFGSTVVCQIAEVEVKEEAYRVSKVVAIVAAGRIVNPQLAENQIEGAIIWALSAFKYGKLTFERGRIVEDNFDTYPIARIGETPELEVHFLEDDGPMGGIGEPGVPALAPAVGNAIFAACGKRVRSMPFTLSDA